MAFMALAMTSPTSATNRRPLRVSPESGRVRAFTLIELLVVIGILVLLAGILIPAVIKALGAAQRSRVSAELSTIATALGQYHDDFTRYPPVDVPNTGAAVLGKALLALGPSSDPAAPFDNTVAYAIFDRVTSAGTVYEANASIAAGGGPPTGAAPWLAVTGQNVAPTYSPATTYTPGSVVFDGATTLYVNIATSTGVPLATIDNWAVFNWSDGAGVGQYRTQPGAKVRDAYLQPDKFKTNGTDILDRNGIPILYFPASPANHQLQTVPTGARGYIADPTVATNVRKSRSMFDPTDNLVPFRAAGEVNDNNSIQRFCAMLGDADPVNASASTNADGIINGNEQPLAAQRPFILWSAGADGVFGPNTAAGKANSPVDTRATDDVTSFQ